MPLKGRNQAVTLKIPVDLGVQSWKASFLEYPIIGPTDRWAVFCPDGSIMWAVAKPSILPTTARKRGNPNWGKLMEPAPDLPTAFEEQVKKLGLSEQTCATSEKLREWCERNKDRSYIPEWLLKRWQISVDPNVSTHR